MGKAYADEIKDINVNTIYHLIRKGRSVSRSSLVRETGLSATSVGRTVARLIENGFVEEAHAIQGKVGRQPITLRVIPERITAISISIVDHLLIAACVDASGRVICDSEAVLEDVSVPAVVEVIKRLVDGILNTITDEIKKNICGMGILITGSADYQTGQVKYSHSLGWRNVNLSEILSYYYSYPIVVDCYTKGLVKTFYYLGYLGGTYQDFLVWNLGEETSIATMISGRVHRGEGNHCGNIGQIVVEPNGSAYEFGPRGCLNALVGRRAVENALGEDVEAALRAYAQGSSEHIAEIEKVLNILAEWMAILLIVFRPPIMVLTGSLVDGSETLFEMIKQRYARYMIEECNDTEIVKSMIEPMTLKKIAASMNIFYKMVIRDGEVAIELKS